MDELAGTENRIAVERMRYNERVQEYNTSRRPFPVERHRRASSASRNTRCSTRRPKPSACRKSTSATGRRKRSADAGWSITYCPSSTTRWRLTRKLLERVPDDRLDVEAAREVVRRSGSSRSTSPTIPMWGNDDAERGGSGPRVAASATFPAATRRHSRLCSTHTPRARAPRSSANRCRAHGAVVVEARRPRRSSRCQGDGVALVRDQPPRASPRPARVSICACRMCRCRRCTVRALTRRS